ncbi:spore germination protein [Metabacillus sp. B2-18]|uniref:spore germination protein n=1 Tax=Metabacillus sp. B2-18 TaxID=2897333 RepID=UPI001E5929D3|nr:spore germination protein [Metabacillus sp. B2-18]UGB32082.1 spore germination protein [Metabacillus sp. B2-18]
MTNSLQQHPKEKRISTDLKENVQNIEKEFGKTNDLSVRQLNQPQNGTNIAIIHLSGIVDAKSLNEHIIEPIIELVKTSNNQLSPSDLEGSIFNTLEVSDISFATDWEKLLSSILIGDTVILLDNIPKAIIAGTQKIESRSITEPTSQTVIRGPKDSFNENIRQNISLIRGRIQNSNMRIWNSKVGTITKTEVAVMYLEGVTEKKYVDEIVKRIESIDIDGVLESNYIEELIQDHKKTLFPLLLNTERPDVVVANLLEGKIAIFIHGTPFVLICPITFIQFFQSPEDYYNNYVYSTFLRLLRVGAFLVNMYATAIYLALITHHQGLIPTTLLVSIMAQRERIPFPAVIEILMMEVAFEVLREAGIRMPRAIGPAVSIVGALILGQAAVEAGFVSAAVVIIVATSAISSFTLPNTSIVNVARGLRFFLLFSSAFIGLFGVLLMSLAILLHLCSLRSFGISYLTPYAPFSLKEQKDSLFRFSFPVLRRKSSSKKN